MSAAQSAWRLLFGRPRGEVVPNDGPPAGTARRFFDRDAVVQRADRFRFSRQRSIARGRGRRRRARPPIR